MVVRGCGWWMRGTASLMVSGAASMRSSQRRKRRRHFEYVERVCCANFAAFHASAARWT